jgi:hypothetical protein
LQKEKIRNGGIKVKKKNSFHVVTLTPCMSLPLEQQQSKFAYSSYFDPKASVTVQLSAVSSQT